MKLNFIYTIIILFICILISYAFYSYAPTETREMYTIGSFIFCFFSGIGLVSLSFKQSRTTVNIKTISGIFFLTGILFNVLSCLFSFKQPTYIIISGILFLIYLLITYSIAKQKQ